MLLALLLLAGVAFLMEGPRLAGRRGREEKRILFAGRREDITRLELSGPGGSMTLRRGKGGWEVGDGPVFHEADPDPVSRLLEMVCEKEGGQVVSRNPSLRESFQVDDDSGLKLAVFTEGGKAAGLIVGGQGPDLFSNYLRREGSDEVLLVKGYYRGLLDRPAKSWRDLTVVSVPEGEVTGIDVSKADARLSLRREGESWKMIAPRGEPADAARVDELLARLSALRAVDIVDEPPADTGLDEPALRISVALKDGSSRGLAVGRLVKETNRHFAKADGKEAVYVLSPYTVSDLGSLFEKLVE